MLVIIYLPFIIVFASWILYLQQLTEDGKLPEKEQHSHHAIHTTMLPNYIPLRVAEKILFVGESVQMFENKKQNTSKYIGKYFVFDTQCMKGLECLNYVQKALILGGGKILHQFFRCIKTILIACTTNGTNAMHLNACISCGVYK